MCEKIFKIKTIFLKLYNFLMGYYIIYYYYLGASFISGGLRPLPKWPIASAGPAYNTPSFPSK